MPLSLGKQIPYEIRSKPLCCYILNKGKAVRRKGPSDRPRTVTAQANTTECQHPQPGDKLEGHLADEISFTVSFITYKASRKDTLVSS